MISKDLIRTANTIDSLMNDILRHAFHEMRFVLLRDFLGISLVFVAFLLREIIEHGFLNLAALACHLFLVCDHFHTFSEIFIDFVFGVDYEEAVWGSARGLAATFKKVAAGSDFGLGYFETLSTIGMAHMYSVKEQTRFPAVLPFTRIPVETFDSL